MAGGTRRLLVRGEERVLERRDERARLDALLALDRANAFHDLLAHELTYPSSIRLPRTIVSYGMSSSFSPSAIRRLRSDAATTGPRKLLLAGDLVGGANLDVVADGGPEVLRPAERPVEAGRRDVDRVRRAVVGEDLGDARAQRVVDALGVVDVDAEPARRQQLDGEHLDTRDGALDRRDDVPGECPFGCDHVGQLRALLVRSEPCLLNKNGRLAPISSSREMRCSKG